jgi:DNA polymerase V
MQILPYISDNNTIPGIDLNAWFIPHPIATYFVRVQGDSMIDAGIFDGDILIVDRSKPAQNGDVVIAELNRELTVKRLELGDEVRLLPENSLYSPITVLENMDFELFGVVTASVRKLR